MIHQLIFAHPRPGMSEQDFQDYWVNIHAVKYASKIPQIRRYLVDTRVPCGEEPDDPLFSGVAEIWLQNEQEQLASLQSEEFLKGARRDEPNWAAFWRTIGLDTETHVIQQGPPLGQDEGLVKLILLVKRRPGMPLDEFRRYALEQHAAKVCELPGLRRYYQCHVVDAFYAIGEAILDAAFMFWFDTTEAIELMWASNQYRDVIVPDLDEFTDPKYRHNLAVTEHWIIGPEFRGES